MTSTTVNYPSIIYTISFLILLYDLKEYSLDISVDTSVFVNNSLINDGFPW